MKCVHIITPVKDSIELTLETVEAVLASKMRTPFTYTVYNDFSTAENTATLMETSRRMGFKLLNMSEITYHPSPNYLLVLQLAQIRALREGAGLLIVESDVKVEEDTLQRLIDRAEEQPDCGMAAAVTVNEKGEINYPYLYAKGYARGNVEGDAKRREEEGGSQHEEKRHLSFCCTLLTPRLLESFDFLRLDPEKNWFDVTISHVSQKLGMRNYLFTDLPVWHRPHGSRPGKQLKYKNPWAYYWRKFTKGLDKI